MPKLKLLFVSFLLLGGCHSTRKDSPSQNVSCTKVKPIDKHTGWYNFDTGKRIDSIFLCIESTAPLVSPKP